MKPPQSKPYLKIGDVARLVGVSPSVIRSWESLGLTRPRRTPSKYRLYTPGDVKLLKRARFLRPSDRDQNRSDQGRGAQDCGERIRGSGRLYQTRSKGASGHGRYEPSHDLS